MRIAKRRRIAGFVIACCLLSPLQAARGEQIAASPLMQAAYRGNLDSMRQLIADGADVNAANATGMTALDYAAGATPIVNQVFRGSADAVKLLLQHNADPNGAARSGFTPLMFATVNGNLDSVRALLHAGADVNAVDRHGDTAVHLAVDYDNVDIAQTLVAAGADLKQKDSNGEDAAAAAARKRIPLDGGSLWASMTDWLVSVAHPLSDQPIRKIVLLRIDDQIAPQTTQALAADLQRDLHVAVTSMSRPLKMAAAYHRSRKQYDASALLALLDTSNAASDQAVIALTGSDLFSLGANFVFSQTDAGDRRMLISLARLRPDAASGGVQQIRSTAAARAEKTALRGIGLMMGASPPIISDACVMSLSNSLGELDAKTRQYCGRLRAQLERLGMID